ncbi:hypothetical protein ACNUDN_30720 (plasmid) [Mycobacterium sp. smrl_JER01]|uniref:hypothetical protein n=1 Tax=Mycobacteriaceae TaxID=1762 RepID=UPI003AC637B7
MTAPEQIAAQKLRDIGLSETLYSRIDFVASAGWPPRPGCRRSPELSSARIWARIDLAEWLDTSPHAFGPHRTNELTVLANIGKALRNAGEGSVVLWALDIIEPDTWIAHPTTALAVTELVCVGTHLTDRLVNATYDNLTAIGWAENPVTHPNSACVINHTTCSLSAWHDGIGTPQHQHPPDVSQWATSRPA